MSFDADHLRDNLAAHGPVVRVLVLDNAGSVPRGAGTSMTVWAEGQDGTIGGGALEFTAVTEARDMLASGAARRHRAVPLGPAMGQCCGGSVTLIWERFDRGAVPDAPYARAFGPEGPMPARVARLVERSSAGMAPVMRDGWLVEAAPTPRRPLWIWGAGHVGRAIVAVLAPLRDVAITWLDTDALRFPGDVPGGVTVVPAADLARVAAHAPRDAEHLILTYSHEIDLALCHAVLTRGFADCGLIGSATKWARFRSRLAALGHERSAINRITCPIGDPALGKHPHAIALGVAADVARRAAHHTIKGSDAGDRDSA